MTRSETQSRKRPAPGTSPPGVQNQNFQSAQITDPALMSNEDFLAWGTGNTLPQAQQSTVYDMENFDGIEPQLNTGNQSNQLVRRDANQQLSFDNRDQQFWNAGVPPSTAADLDDFAELEQRALAAKKDAQSKKPPKQVQPFIQKLWSLLTDNTNTDLIRWTPKGDSFVVLDEERFASEQLPTYFKHDNYPSFVRQLNMYGFHKRVGLTDNSMKASKTKSKSPSEYENAFFQRDRPILQWLITKPKQPSSKAKGRKPKDDDEDSGEENTATNEPPPAPVARREENTQRKSLDLVSVPRTQLIQYQDEISQLKRSQSQINQMIARFQHENNQYIRRASAQHERHEQSINAILQFLATFYAQGQDSSNIQNMFHGAIHNQQPHGNVQEMGDIDDSMSPSVENQLARMRRQPLLLQAPPAEVVQSATPEATSRPSSRPASQQQPLKSPARAGKTNSETPQPRSSATPNPTTRQTSGSPPSVAPDGKPQDQTASTPSNDMLAVINNMNANTPGGAPNIDVNLALRNYEDMNNGPMTPEQRDNMLSMLANTSGLSPSTSNALLATTGANNSNSTNTNTLGTPQAALSQWSANKDQLDMLQRLQQEQDSKVQNLAGRIQPLSPSGSIPGFEQAYHNGDINFDNYLNSDFFNSDSGAGGTGDAWDLDGNFNLDHDTTDYFGSAGANANANGDAAGAASNLSSGDGNGLFDSFDAPNADTNALFNMDDGGFDAANAAVREEPGEGGRVIGSVTNSEGDHTPNAGQEGEEEGERRRKRQRV